MSDRFMHRRDPLTAPQYCSGISRRYFLTALGAAPVISAQQSQEPETVIRVDVDRVNVVFSVRDKRSGFVNTLTKDDIEVKEDGRRQEILTFARETDLPLTIGLLVDVSVSQQRLIEVERQAAAQFFRQVLRPKDLAFLISFGSEAELLQDSTSSVRALEQGLGEMRGNSSGGPMINPGPIPSASAPRGTILYDAVYLAAQEKLRQEVGRKAIVLITDGVDQGSRVKKDEAIHTALRADSMIYSIYYVDPGFYGYGGGGDGTLKDMAEDTGGRMLRVDRKNTLDDVFRQIQDEMRSQYAISYSSTNNTRDGGFRKLEVKTNNKDLKVQARKGYFAPSA